MLSLATFCNRAPDENISVAICSSLMSFSRALPGALPAQLPELSVPRWAQGPGFSCSVPQTGSVTLAGLCLSAARAKQEIIFLYFLQCNVRINQVRTVAAGDVWEPMPSRGSALDLGQTIRSFVQINSVCLPPYNLPFLVTLLAPKAQILIP